MTLIYPGVQLHRLYSINFQENLRVLLEDLHQVDIQALRKTLKASPAHLSIVHDGLYVNTVDKIVSLVGYPLSKGLYVVSKEKGSTIHLSYTCETTQILEALGYLSHMYEGIVDY